MDPEYRDPRDERRGSGHRRRSGASAAGELDFYEKQLQSATVKHLVGKSKK